MSASRLPRNLMDRTVQCVASRCSPSPTPQHSRSLLSILALQPLLTHWQEAVRSLLVAEDLVAHLLWHGAGTVALSHRLYTGTDTDVDLSRRDGVGDLCDRLETRGALSVESHDGGRRRETGCGERLSEWCDGPF